jgi:ABC-type uncharacterized transport system permease subunit
LSVLAEISIGLHVLATIFFLAYLLRFRTEIARMGRWSLWAALLLQAGVIVAGFVGGESGDSSQTVRTLYLVAFAIDLLYLLVALRYEVDLLGAVIVPISTAVLLAILFVQYSAQTEGAPVMGVLTKIHIGASLLGFAAFTVSFFASAAYVAKDHALRTKSGSVFGRKLPSLARLEKVSFGTLLFGFPVFTVGVLLGTVWVGQTGLAALIQPQVVFSMIAWLVFGIVVQMYVASGWRGKRAALMNMIGYLMVLLAVCIYALRALLGI